MLLELLTSNGKVLTFEAVSDLHCIEWYIVTLEVMSIAAMAIIDLKLNVTHDQQTTRVGKYRTSVNKTPG